MEPFVGEIRMFGGNYAPQGWAFCDGRLLAIAEHQELYTLIGTTYGGDGSATFALPDLRGRVPIHPDPGAGYPRGTAGGAETVALAASQFPAHGHTFYASDGAAESSAPGDNVVAAGVVQMYAEGDPNVAMSAAAIAPAVDTAGQQYGAGAPHENMQPFQCVNFIIALEGIFPPRD
ncbi:MAG TPA: tail fiber protein [Longimicrobiales bacterium]